MIAQLPIAEKENEKTAIPKLLRLLNITGSLITIDAMGTAQPVMNAIREQEGDYLLTVKKGNPLTYEELEEMFANLSGEKKDSESKEVTGYGKQLESYEIYKTSEKKRSRMEYRTMQVCHNTELITVCSKQTEISTVGWLEQVRIPMEKDCEGNDITPDYSDFLKKGTVRKPRVTTGDNLTDDIHRVGIISSRVLTARKALEIKREHWKIENSLHHVLDELFGEDRSSARKSKNNLAVIRKIAYNLIRIAIINEKKDQVQPK